MVTHKASIVTGKHGPKALTMLFSGDNRAIMVDENGETINTLDGISTQATAYYSYYSVDNSVDDSVDDSVVTRWVIQLLFGC